MGFNFNFFGDSEHRVFRYKPRYYDEEAEQRRKFFGTVGSFADETDSDGNKKEYVPGSYLRDSFRNGNYQMTRKSGRTTRIIGIVGLILFFVILYFIAKFYALILQ